MLPNFNLDGLLPPGDYSLTLDQLKESHLVTGNCSEFSDTWEQEWRADNPKGIIRIIQSED